MNLMHDALAGFSAELYVATLSKIAHSDGLHPAEQEILEQHASQFGIELDALPDVPEDLADLPSATRILVYRDAYMLTLADGSSSTAEEESLAELAAKMALQKGTTDAIRRWVRDYATLLEQFDELLQSAD